MWLSGFATPTERGTEGYTKAVVSAVEQVIPWDELLPLITSIATDGESMNTGLRHSLWTWLDEERNRLNCSQPLIKMWCAVHRSNLAWGDLTKNVGEVKRIISDAKAVATYFHTSGLRTEEMLKVAKEHGIDALHFPTYFEVRWAQYVHELLKAVLHNWKAITVYWQQINDSEARGFKKTWTEVGRMRLLALLLDVLAKLARFQQRLQADDTLILDVRKHSQDFVKQLEEMQNKPIPGRRIPTLHI